MEVKYSIWRSNPVYKTMPLLIQGGQNRYKGLKIVEHKLLCIQMIGLGRQKIKPTKKPNLTSRGRIRPFERGRLTPMLSDQAGPTTAHASKDFSGWRVREQVDDSDTD